MSRSIVLGLMALSLAAGARAQDHPEHPEHPQDRGASSSARPASEGVVKATLTGENVCLGCMLKKEKGAAAQCSRHGHRHGLKVTSAQVAGRDAPDLRGWVLHYLDTDASEPFVDGHHGETVTLTGNVYLEERVLEVTGRPSADGKPARAKPRDKPEHPEHPQ